MAHTWPSTTPQAADQGSIMQESRQGPHSSPRLPENLRLSNRFAFLDGLEGGTRMTHAPEMTSIPPEASANHINRVIVYVRTNSIALSQSDLLCLLYVHMIISGPVPSVEHRMEHFRVPLTYSIHPNMGAVGHNW